MEKWAEIRRLVLVEGQSKRSVSAQFGIHWDTLVKILNHPEPPGHRLATPRQKPMIGPYIGIIEEMLRQHKDVHRKQRHTKKRISQRLRDEHGYPVTSVLHWRLTQRTFDEPGAASSPAMFNNV